MRPLPLFLLIFAGLSLSAGEVSGVVTVVDHRDNNMDLESDRVVIYIQETPSKIPKALVNAKYHMDTRGKQYTPRIMVIPVGATVNFKNFDPIRHNVFSVSGQNRFDGGLFEKEETFFHTFQHEGLVRVYCNVHHDMSSLILVTPNPWYTYSDNSGKFVLKDVPDGQYTITALHRVAGDTSTSVKVLNGNAEPVTLHLKQEKKRKRHLNKHGKPYKKPRSRRY